MFAKFKHNKVDTIVNLNLAYKEVHIK